MRGTLARIGAGSVCLFSEAGLAPFPRFGSFRRPCAAITANPLRPHASLLAHLDFPLYAQRQQSNVAKLKADAQKVVSIISGDKAKTQREASLSR
jgi:hypothetical protein